MYYVEIVLRRLLQSYRKQKTQKISNYLSVFRQAQSVGKQVGRFLVFSSSGVLTDLSVGNWGLHGTSLWKSTKCGKVKGYPIIVNNIIFFLPLYISHWYLEFIHMKKYITK